MRLRNETITLGLNKKPLNSVLYERIDDKNVRIGTTWIQWVTKTTQYDYPFNVGVVIRPTGVKIYGSGFKRFIANSWYQDEDIEKL